jgi:DNA invertase Pin-like site-specific DNA recombinase
MLVGFASDSGASDPLGRQLRALSDAGCAKIFVQQDSTTSAATPDALQSALDFVRDGDTLVVAGIDSPALCASDLHEIITRLGGSGVGFHCLHQSSVNPDWKREASPAVLGTAALERDIEVEAWSQRPFVDAITACR